MNPSVKEARDRERWTLGWEVWVREAYTTAELHNLLPTPNPEPRFHLLISLINHSPSSYPHQRI